MVHFSLRFGRIQKRLTCEIQIPSARKSRGVENKGGCFILLTQLISYCIMHLICRITFTYAINHVIVDNNLIKFSGNIRPGLSTSFFS